MVAAAYKKVALDIKKMTFSAARVDTPRFMRMGKKRFGTLHTLQTLHTLHAPQLQCTGRAKKPKGGLPSKVPWSRLEKTRDQLCGLGR
jgi:hypothetical protein